MNKLLFVMLAILIAAELSGINLEVPTRTTLAIIPNGKQQGALYYGQKNPYEPYRPTAIEITPTSDYVVNNGVSGIIVFDKNFMFKGEIRNTSEFYEDILISDRYLFAWPWRPATKQQLIEVYDLAGSSIKRFSLGEISNFGRITSVAVMHGFVLILTDSDNLVTMKITPTRLTPSTLDELTRFGNTDHLTFDQGKLKETGRGVITTSAEIFFQETNQPEIQTATIDDHQDPYNMANGTIFGIDADANRYIFLSEGRVAIASSQGTLLKVFDVRSGISPDTSICRPCVSLSGEITYIESTKMGHKVVRISRNW